MYSFEELFGRNIGIISHEEQEKLKSTKVAIFGVGGLGAIVSEILVRSGIESIKIIEPDDIEPSNLNRHIFSYQHTIGKAKRTVAKEFLKNINPNVNIEIFYKEDHNNLDEILSDIDCIVMAADKIHASMLVTRRAHELNIPLVEGWGIPYANVRVFTKETKTFEEAYGLPTIGKDIRNLSEKEIEEANLHLVKSLTSIEGVDGFYNDSAREKILKGIYPSFAPFVWFTAVLMSIETVKVILNWGNINYAPEWSLYDPINNTIPKQKSYTHNPI